MENGRVRDDGESIASAALPCWELALPLPPSMLSGTPTKVPCTVKNRWACCLCFFTFRHSDPAPRGRSKAFLAGKGPQPSLGCSGCPQQVGQEMPGAWRSMWVCMG